MISDAAAPLRAYTVAKQQGAECIRAAQQALQASNRGEAVDRCRALHFVDTPGISSYRHENTATNMMNKHMAEPETNPDPTPAETNHKGLGRDVVALGCVAFFEALAQDAGRRDRWRTLDARLAGGAICIWMRGGRCGDSRAVPAADSRNSTHTFAEAAVSTARTRQLATMRSSAASALEWKQR